MLEFKEKRAIVIGGTSGIGRATALRLRDRGARVVVAGRDAEKIQQAEADGLDARCVDVLDRAALSDLFTALAPIDFLVNAATGGPRALGPFLEMDLDGYQESFRKLWGYANAVRLGATHMSDTGAIVLVSGAPARRAKSGQAALASVGGAVEAFVRAITPELAPIRINVVSPGVIDTPLIPGEGAQRAERIGKATAKQAVSRAGTADEVADAIVFALANPFVAGSVIDVDGGWQQA